MGQMLVVTLREGLEAFLIVAIAAAYLRKSGRAALLPAVWWGVAVSAALSLAIGGWLLEYAVQPVWEGVLALVAGVLVVSMAIYMQRAGRYLKADIGAKLEAAAVGAGAWFAVFLFTVLMITREGVEMAFVTVAISKNEGSGDLLAGALAGTLLAAALAWAWLRLGHKVDLALFFQATSIYLVLFALQLALYAFHEFTEAEVLPIDNSYWHVATEDYAEGRYARFYSALMILLPLAWIASAGARRKRVT